MLSAGRALVPASAGKFFGLEGSKRLTVKSDALLFFRVELLAHVVLEDSVLQVRGLFWDFPGSLIFKLSTIDSATTAVTGYGSFEDQSPPTQLHTGSNMESNIDVNDQPNEGKLQISPFGRV